MHWRLYLFILRFIHYLPEHSGNGRLLAPASGSPRFLFDLQERLRRPFCVLSNYHSSLVSLQLLLISMAPQVAQGFLSSLCRRGTVYYAASALAI